MRTHRTAMWALALTLASAGCGAPTPRPVVAAAPPPLDLPATITIGAGSGVETRITRLALDDYVAGVVAAEWSFSGMDPRLVARVAEVQAIVARTYAIASLGRHGRDRFDLCDTTHCQLYRPFPDRFAHRMALDAGLFASRRVVLTFERQPVLALYHADCGGHTNSASEVWGGADRPYLAGVPDPECARRADASWTYRASRAALAAALARDPRTSVGRWLERVEVVDRGPNGLARLVALAGERSPLVRGEELRAVLVQSFGPGSIRSPRYTTRIEGDLTVFEGRGRGHGVGLCQKGAAARLQGGATARDVLAHYFPGARPVSLSASRATSAAGSDAFQ